MPLPLVSVLVLLLALLGASYLLYEVRRRTSLVRELRTQPKDAPRPSAEVDVDSSQLFVSPAPLGAKAHYLVFDTETFDLIPDEESTEGYDNRPIALSWQLLDEQGNCLLEESHVLHRREPLSPEATALHGLTSEDLYLSLDGPRQVYERFLSDLHRAQCLVAHHLAFHCSVLSEDFVREGLDPSPLTSTQALCMMEHGRSLGFKRNVSGESLYPRITELFGYLYFSRPSLRVSYTSKSLRDVRLCAASLRRILP